MKNASTRTMIALAISTICFFCIILTCLLLIVSGTVTLSIYGFAVDHKDRLYIGRQGEIQIFEGSKLVNSIHVPTSRTYVFTIQDGNRIFLSTSTKIHIMDLDGNILETKEDLGADAYNQISYHKKTFVSDSGDTYRLSNMLGWTRIIKNKSDVVYQIDGCSFAVKILMVICFVAMFVFSIWMLSHRNQKSKPNYYFDSH